MPDGSGHCVLSCITEGMESARNSGHSYPPSRCQYLERSRTTQAASPRGCGSPYTFHSGGCQEILDLRGKHFPLLWGGVVGGAPPPPPNRRGAPRHPPPP